MITQDQQHQNIPVIFVTVVDDQVAAKEFNNMTQAVWLTKPFKEEELLEKIEKLLKQKQTQK
ncbi:Uncharacterised protein [uncultured archaeon]|nr:Uncharacterised protein [uncultured archaeon]